jgi:cell division septation protein DedD
MPTMVTFQAGRAALYILLAGITAACSGEQQDWRSAEAAGTPEAWQRFVEQHPYSELLNQARERITQLEVQRDFQHADRVGTVEAYREFLARHPSGKWSEPARIRIESFSLGSAPRIAPPTPEEAAAFGGSGVRALRLATAATAGAAVAAGDDGQAGDGGPAEAVEPRAVPVGAASEADAPVPAAIDAAQAPAEPGRAVPGEAAQAPDDSALVRPAAAIEPETRTGYGVQLGAFGSEASADREWRRLQGRFGPELGNLSPRIVVAESDSRQLYRLQAPAAGEAQARAICDLLREQSQACIPVYPR